MWEFAFFMDNNWHTDDAISEAGFKRFWAILNLLRNLEALFGQTTVDQSLWMVYATFRLVQMVFCGHNVMCHRTITFFNLLHDAKRDFGRYTCTLSKWNPEVECMYDFLENFKPSSHGMVQTLFHMCDCAPLCQIWGHLNNARWINGREVAIRVEMYMIDSHHRTSTLRVGWYRNIVSSSLLFSCTIIDTLMMP